MTAIANQARAALGKKPIGDLNAAIYSTSVHKTAAFLGIVPIKDGTAPSGYLHNNQIWDTDADGNVVPDAVPGYPTTAGYDLTTRVGQPARTWLRLTAGRAHVANASRTREARGPVRAMRLASSSSVISECCTPQEGCSTPRSLAKVGFGYRTALGTPGG